MATVIVSAPLPGGALARLEREGHHVIVGESVYGLGHEGFIAALHEAPEAEALIPLLSDEIGRCVLNAAPERPMSPKSPIGGANAA